MNGGAFAGRDGEIAVNPGHDTVGGTLLNYESTDDRLAAAVHDRSLEGNVLCPCSQTESHSKDQSCNLFH